MVVMASIHMHRRNTSRALSTVDIPERVHGVISLDVVRMNTKLESTMNYSF